MRDHSATVRRHCAALATSLFAGLAALVLGGPPAWSDPPPAAETAEAKPGLQVPPIPPGTPEEVLAVLEGLFAERPQPQSPQEQEQFFEYLRAASRAAIEAIDRTFPTLTTGDAVRDRAARLKLESLLRLWQLGDQQSGQDLEAFATTLAKGRGDVAEEAARMAIMVGAQRMMMAGTAEAAPALVKKAAELATANPDDEKTAGLIMQLCALLERIPGGEAAAADSLTTLGPILAGSTNPRIKQLGESFADRLRLVSLIGKPLEISGRLVDDTPFDLKSLAGKVVLVDFWATWCGPCIAELPGVIQLYEKYHDKGFEVIGVSLDQDRDGKTAKEQIIEAVGQHKIPWPILLDGARLAQQHGVSGIPQMIVLGRDGNVIAINVRGGRLAELLDAAFKDADD